MQPNQRTTVGLVALILPFLGLGWLGIHKFMMGYNKVAIIWIVASIATCGIGAAVFTVISIVDGIIYLTMSDQQWYATYVVGKKDWF